MHSPGVATCFIALIMIAGLPGTTWAAQQASEVPAPVGTPLGTVQVEGSFTIGVRVVDVGGAENKFRQQYDLDDGVRIQNSRLVIRPQSRTEGRLFDRVEITGNGLGGDPYETWGVAARKMGTYDVRVRSRTVDYFYDVLGDPHAWDVKRQHFDVNAAVNVTPGFVVTADFNRFRQDGSRETTRDLVRDEFHFHEPVDQTGQTYGFGFRWKVKTTSFFFNQDFHEFKDNSGFTSGPNAGGDTATFIDMLSNSEVRAMNAPVSRGGFRTVALDRRLDLYGDFLYSKQKTAFDFVRLWEGLDRFAVPSSFTETNSGQATREVRHANLTARMRAHEIVYATFRYRHRDWDQTGDSIGENITLFFDEGDFSQSRGSALSSYRVTADQFMFGGEVIPTPQVSIFGEVGFTDKDNAFDKEEIEGFPRGSGRSQDVESGITSFRVGGSVRPDPRVDVNLTFAVGDLDDPLTQITPTEADTFKLRARFRPSDPWSVSFFATHRATDNTISDYTFDNTTFGGSISYSLTSGSHATFGYSRLDSDSAIPFTFILDDRTQGESVSAYEAQTNVFTLSGGGEVFESFPVKLYGSLAYVDNSGTNPLSRYDIHVGGRYTFPQGFFIDLRLRFIDYQQELFHEQGIILAPDEPSDVNDFDAQLFTVGLGFTF